MKALHPATLTKSPGSSKKSPPSRTKYIWRLQSLASPVKCVSIRGQQVHFGRTEPSFGTRWAVQACMRLDTWQVRVNAPLHTPRCYLRSSCRVYRHPPLRRIQQSRSRNACSNTWSLRNACGMTNLGSCGINFGKGCSLEGAAVMETLKHYDVLFSYCSCVSVVKPRCRRMPFGRCKEFADSHSSMYFSERDIST